ncbi:hypothetical protein [Photobacterium leiognathi]|uniref:hypothetical protein n=1 Tax=Photobacterium leiognathi TaxID=553611 RepID=UPI002981241F|nr:hypothetical protein [Photobacterium leiognathi]
MNRLQVALIALFVGWVLSQLTEYIKGKRKTTKLKSAIELELNDLEELLKQREKTAKSSALKYGHNGNYAFSIGAPISTPVLDAYYSEVAASFTSEQRYNIRVFRDHIRSYNSIIKWLEETIPAKTTQNETVFKLFEAYKQSSFARVYIKAANKVGGREKIEDDHEDLNNLRETFNHLSAKLAFK